MTAFNGLFHQAGRVKRHSGEMHADEGVSPREAAAVRKPRLMGAPDEVRRTLLLYWTLG